VVKDKDGRVTEIRCTHDPATRGGNAPDGRKVKGTIHWVSAPHAYSAEVRLYDHLFETEFPDEATAGRTFLDNINPDSLEVLRDAKLEPSLAKAAAGSHSQFERLGYFFADPGDSRPGHPVFNRTVTLRDTWAKEAGKG
jgi:glutaminyl-tRNA synthetase